jgi:hypothetical protein
MASSARNQREVVDEEVGLGARRTRRSSGGAAEDVGKSGAGLFVKLTFLRSSVCARGGEHRRLLFLLVVLCAGAAFLVSSTALPTTDAVTNETQPEEQALSPEEQSLSKLGPAARAAVLKLRTRSAGPHLRCAQPSGYGRLGNNYKHTARDAAGSVWLGADRIGGIKQSTPDTWMSFSPDGVWRLVQERAGIVEMHEGVAPGAARPATMPDQMVRDCAVIEDAWLSVVKNATTTPPLTRFHGTELVLGARRLTTGG